MSLPIRSLRWERTAPYQELIISNGQTAWHVEPDLNQAIRLDQRMVRGWAEVFEPGVANQHYTSTHTGQVVALRRRADASLMKGPTWISRLIGRGGL